MPVLRELMGVICERCRDAGHRCQAQIVIDGIALCLRCADDEPCIFIIAAQLSEATPVDYDPCSVPAPSREDLRAVRAMPSLPSIHATTNVSEELKLGSDARAAILADTALTTAELSAKYGVSKTTIQHVLRLNRRKLREQALRAIEMQIGGEDVRMAPMAVMGAEMLSKKK
jgi:hypothetical protein